MSDFTKGYGAKFGYADVGGSSFTYLARVLEIKPPKTSVDSIDTSHLESPYQWKEKAAGWKDTGEAEVKVQFKKDQTAAVYGLLALDKSFQILLADGSTLDFDGFLSGIEPEIDKEGLVTATLTFTVSGKVEFAAAA
jgi:hypothetical protein